jgi:nitrile hydratase
MTRVHDMGGRFGDAPITPEPDGIPQLGDWQARALALTLASGALGQWNIDTSRHARERLSPLDYSRFTYFEKWISALADLLVEKGVLTPEDLKEAAEDPSHPLAEKKLTPEAVAGMLAKGGPSERAATAPSRFSPGQGVRVRQPGGNTLVDGGHTRLPAYVAGARGYIQLLHGAHVLPDSNAHGLGEAPEPLYAVRFSASQLWTHPEHPDDEVILDLWESYLEPL